MADFPITVRFSHNVTRAPFFELNVKLSTMVKDLHVLVLEKMRSEESCPVRIFFHWCLVREGSGKEPLSLDEYTTQTKTLAELKFEHLSVVLLDGPITSTADGVGMALAQSVAFLSAKLAAQEARNDQLQATLQHYLPLIVANQRRLEVNQWLSDLKGIDEPAERARIIASETESFSVILERTIKSATIHKRTTVAAAAARLLRYPGKPMKALYEALSDTAIFGHSLALAIVNNPDCGLERRSTDQEACWSMAGVAAGAGSTPLFLSVNCGRYEAVKELLSMGANINAVNNAGQTLLVVAVKNGFTSIAELLVSNGAVVNVSSNDGETVLHLAAATGNAALIRLFVAHDAKINAKNSSSKTPLECLRADCTDRAEMLKLLTIGSVPPTKLLKS